LVSVNYIHYFVLLLTDPAGMDNGFIADPGTLLRPDWCSNITGCSGRSLWATRTLCLLFNCCSVLFWHMYHIPYCHWRPVWQR